MTRLPQVLVNVDGVDKSRTDEDPLVAAAVAEAEAEPRRDLVLLRPSGTEPLVRVMVEAGTAEQAGAVLRSGWPRVSGAPRALDRPVARVTVSTEVATLRPPTLTRWRSGRSTGPTRTSLRQFWLVGKQAEDAYRPYDFYPPFESARAAYVEGGRPGFRNHPGRVRG